MKTSILSLALGIVLACPVAAYAGENTNTNIFEDLFHGWDHGHRAHDATVTSNWHDPFKPRTTDGLSSNIDACASYGCVGAGGGGD